MRRRHAITVLGSSLAYVALGAPGGAQALLPVHVGASVDNGLTPILYALNTGIFKRAGLDVTLTQAPNGAALAAAVAGGSVDIGKAALMALITAHDHGVDLKIVAGGIAYHTGNPTTQVVVMKTSGIASFADLNGKTVVVGTLKSLDMLATQAMIDRSAGDSSTVHFVELPYIAMLGALGAQRVAAASIAEPYLQAALDTGNVRALGDPYDAIAKQFLMAGWFSTGDFTTRNPVIVRKFAAAVREAALYTNAHPAETVAMFAQYTGMDPEVLKRTHRDVNATELTATEVQPAIDAAYKYRYIDKPFPAQALIAPQ